jgi:hypothetical protein
MERSSSITEFVVWIGVESSGGSGVAVGEQYFVLEEKRSA